MSADRETTIAEIARRAREVLARSSAAALVVDPPSGRIIAASQAAQQLLGATEEAVLGRHLEDLFADAPSGGLKLFARGRLDSYQTGRSLRRSDGSELGVTAWVRVLEDQPRSRVALVVLVPDASSEKKASAPPPPGGPLVPVLGAADGSLLIERISGAAEGLFGIPVQDMLGRSLVGLAAPDDVVTWLAALAKAAASQHAVTLSLRVRRLAGAAAGEPITCDALIVPLQPAPGCVFALVPTRPGAEPDVPPADDLESVLRHLLRAAELAEVGGSAAREMSDRTVPGLSRLTQREIDITARLLSGDRVPIIAADLFLSQSTIRNHLAAVYAKLGVGSQQELIEVFRGARSGAFRGPRPPR